MSAPFLPLPYATNALEPIISKKTLEIHHGKHYQNYISTLNRLIKGTPFDQMELSKIFMTTTVKEQAIFNSAAQAWNHEFYFNCMTTEKNQKPSAMLVASIKKHFDSTENFKTKFTESALKLFGSGWTWLVKDTNGDLKVVNLKDADSPLIYGYIPLLTCDVWEHAYYLDYQNERSKYLEHFWELVNWKFVSEQASKSTTQEEIKPFHKHLHAVTDKPFQENVYD